MKKPGINKECFQYVKRVNSGPSVQLSIGGEMFIASERDCYMCPDCGRLVDTLYCNGVCKRCEPTPDGYPVVVLGLLLPRVLFYWIWRSIRAYRSDKEYASGSFTDRNPRGVFTPEFESPDDDD